MRNQPKKIDLKSALLGGGAVLAIGVASYFGTNHLIQKNKQPQTLNQEQIDKNISFANKYPEIFNLAIDLLR